MREFFPDGTIIDDWFYDIKKPDINNMGKKYILTDYNIFDDGKIYTKEIQGLIDLAYENGGGVIVVPKGTFMTGALNFKQGVNLYLCKDSILMGSDDISDYYIDLTRIEGETCMYYTALINADNIDGFTIFGEGIIDGNGLRAWKAFWQRRKWNPKCTNKDEQRPRLVYISNSKNVMICDVTLRNSNFWTTHIYKCDHVKYLNCKIYSPKEPIKAPSTDAIDIDVCRDVLIKNCYLEVNDDSVVLKGGKGLNADTDINNGSNERIIIEDCVYGFCHGCLTCGSESVHNKNIIMRRIKVNSGKNLLWLKMRPDTPQLYEHILIEEVEGNISSFLNINPWVQFSNIEDKSQIPLSYARNIAFKNCTCNCSTFFHVKKDDTQYRLSNFMFENLNIIAMRSNYKTDVIEDDSLINVNIIEKPL